MDREPTGSRWDRLTRYLKEVRSELSRVVWPTSRELVVYTIVVLLTVAVMASFVTALDLVFARLIVRIFTR